MRHSRKLEKIPPYLFAEVDRLIERKREGGTDVISFGVGDPDMPTPPVIVEALREQVLDPEHHRYPSYQGLPEFRSRAAEWLRDRFGVQMDPDSQVLSLMGSKEGIAHMAFSLLDPGDVALVPEPGYPVYEMGTLLAGGEPYLLPLEEDNGFLPRLAEIPGEVLDRARVLWLNYPNNPTGAVAPEGFFEEAIALAGANDFVLAHDNAYSEITYDGYVAPSIFEFKGSEDVAIEFHSLSKTFNMTGWRIGFACGNPEIVEALGTVKTNIDSGIFNPIQLAGITALENIDAITSEMRSLYTARREKLVAGLRGLGWEARPPLGSIYIWLPVPEGFDSVGFSTYVLEEAGVFFTPGNAYGPSGEGYVRISMTVPDERIEAALSRLEEVFLT